MTGNYITPYALSLGVSTSQIGLLNALQGLASALSQIPAARLPERIGRKTLWCLSNLGSKLLLIPLLALAVLPFDHVLALIVIVIGIAFLGGLGGPAWSSLMADIVPPEERGSYFGKRNAILGITSVLAMGVAGLVLFLFGFGVLFCLAMIAGIIGVWWFSRIPESVTKKPFHYKHTFSFDVRRMINSIRVNRNFVIFTVYMAIVSFGIAIASPFYAVWMLREIGIGYLWYTAFIVLNCLVVIISQPYWGKIADRYGNRTIMVITGVGIVFIPIFWMMAYSVPVMLAIAIYDGFIFGGWSLVVFNFMLATAPVDKRTNYFANHTLFVGLATVAGMLMGTIIVEAGIVTGIGCLLLLFALSAAVRALSLILLPTIHRAYSEPEIHEPIERIAWRILVVDPAKFVSSLAGHVYDLGWLRRKMMEGFKTIIYKIRIMKT
jgi:MFS family permease